MSEIRKCPECDNRVVVSDRLAERDNGMDIGCKNTGEHEAAGVLVMWSGNDE